MDVINITALRHSAFYSPLLVTIAANFLQQEGLEPHYRPARRGEDPTLLLRSGGFHLSQSAVATSFAGLEAGQTCDIVHFAQINQRDGFFIAAREPGTDFAWSDLVGREVLVDHLFQPLAMLRYALHQHGIDFNELQVIDAGNVDDIDRAFRAGRGAFVHQQGPAPQQLEQDDVAHVVASVGEIIGLVAFSSLCAHRDWINSDAARAFMRAYRKGLELVTSAPAIELAELARDFFPNITPQVLSETIGTYQRLGCWSVDPTITPESYERLLDVFLHSGLISKRHPAQACIVSPPI